MSIRRYLVLTLFSVLTLITFIAAIQGYKVSMSRAEKQFDQQLLDIAHTLLAVQATALQTANPTNIDNTNKPHQVANVPQQGSFAFQVWKNDKLVIKSNNSPDHLIVSSVLFENQLSYFSEVNFLEKRWRVLSIFNETIAQATPTIRVIVAQPIFIGTRSYFSCSYANDNCHSNIIIFNLYHYHAWVKAFTPINNRAWCKKCE